MCRNYGKSKFDKMCDKIKMMIYGILAAAFAALAVIAAFADMSNLFNDAETSMLRPMVCLFCVIASVILFTDFRYMKRRY